MAIETELLVKAIAKGFEGVEKNFKDLETAEEKAAVKAAVMSRESAKLSQQLADGKKNLAQVSAEMKRLDDSMPIDGLEEMGDTVSDNSTKWTEMSSKLDVAKQAFAAVAGTAQAVFETMKEGATIKAAAANFEKLTSDMGGSTAAMEGMRSATSGMVDDMTLMSSANSLMTMGIATNSAELSKNMEIVTKLKKPTDSAAEAMENWAALMANQSLPRLDSFGISSGAVKTRINELMAETKGLTREQAFNTAVLEEAENAMLNVADTTEGQLANVERLEASWANFTNTLKVAVADALAPAVENAAGLTNQVGEMADAADNGRSAWTNTMTVLNEINKAFGGADADEWVQGLKDAEQAAFEMNKRSEAQARAMQGVADVLPMTTDEMISYSAAAADAAGENEELTDKFSQQNNMLSDSEVRLAGAANRADELAASQQELIAAENEAAEAAAQLAAAEEAAAAAAAELAVQSGDLFTKFQEGAPAVDASGASLMAMADAGGASAEQLALLAIATGELSEAEATALIQQVALEQSLAALGTQYAEGTLSIDEYVTAANAAVEEVSNLTVSSEEAKIESTNLGAAAFEAAHAMTIESGKADNLVESLVAIPGDVNFLVTGDGLDDAIAKVNALKGGLAGLGDAGVRDAVTSGEATVRGGNVGAAAGLSNFVVPPGFPNDSFMIGVTSGEGVDVRTQGQQSSGGGGQRPINITINESRTPQATANAVGDKLLAAQRAEGDT